MKKTLRVISVICVLAMLLSAFSFVLSASETPIEPELWTEPDFETDHAYSIAFVGDTQYITNGDDYYGTKKLNKIYKSIVDTAKERKLEHVFVLGDITDGGYWNDGSLAGHHENPAKFGEWEVAKEAISQLDGKVSYSLCRGNHDDYAIDDYFNVPAYTNQFEGCGGFFSDVEGKHSTVRDNMATRNPDGYILWSAKREQDTGNGRYTSSIVNSYKAVELCGTKYLFITVDFNPEKGVIDWLNKLLSKYPDHRAIITTHAYLTSDGSIITSNSGDTMYPTAYSPSVLWDLVLSKHKNVFMVVSGHVGVNDIVYSYNIGENGNKVLQVLVDPQSYDLKDVSWGGPLEKLQGKQDTGLVLYMNFSEDGNTITFDYYSTLLDKFLKLSNDTIKIEAPEETSTDNNTVIDMSNLSDYGQTVDVVERKRTASLDGMLGIGEYPLKRTVELGALGKGRINSDLTECFAYDKKYIYFAFSGNFSGAAPILEIRPDDALYTVAELDGGEHNKRITVTLADKNCVAFANADIDVPINEKDISCRVRDVITTGKKTYEIRISRSYLENNGIPDSMLSYVLKFSTGTRCFSLNSKAQKYLGAFGIDGLDWTYNYVYFDQRGKTVENPKVQNDESSANLAENTPEKYSTVALDYALDSKNVGVEIMKVPTAYKTPNANGVIDEGEYSYSYTEESKPIYLMDYEHTTVVDDIMDAVGAEDLKNSVLNKNYFDYRALVDGIKTEYYFAHDSENIYIATKLDAGAIYFDEDNNGVPDTINFGGEEIKYLRAVISRDHQTYRLGFNMDDPSDCIYIENNMNSRFDATSRGNKKLIVGDKEIDITGSGIVAQMYRCAVAKETGWENHSCNSLVKKGQIIDHNNPGTEHYMITEMVINKAALLEVLKANGIEYEALPNAFFFSMCQNGQVIGQLNDDKKIAWLSDGDAGFWSLNGSRYYGSADIGRDFFPDLVVFTDGAGVPTKEEIFATLEILEASESSEAEEKSKGCSSSLGVTTLGLIASISLAAAFAADKKKKFSR